MRRWTAGLVMAGVLVTACTNGSGVESRGVEEVTVEVTVDPVTSDSPVDTIPTPDPTAETVPGTEMPVDTEVPPADGSWTVLVYSIADTDLEPYMMDDLDELGTVGGSGSLDIVGLVDRSADYSADPVLGLDDWEGAKLLHIGDGGAEVLSDLGDVDTGDPQLLADFIATGIAEYPAEHYALVISDHGASWPGVGGDESAGGNGLDLAELSAGIAGGLEGAGVEQLDLLGFDACLMASYEVASAMAPLAHRMLASQELEPGHGWDYTVFQLLDEDPATDVDTLGAALIDGFEQQAATQGTDAKITLSLVDLDQMATVDAAMTDFAGVLADRAASLGASIGQTRETTLGFGRSPDPAEDTQMVDLGILVSEIGVEALDVSAQADALVRAINDVVLDSVSGAATRGATGLSIYFPPEEQWFDQDYTSVSSAASWTGFLDAYYTSGASIPLDAQPQFENLDKEATIELADDGVYISGTFDLAAQAFLSTASFEYGIVGEDGSITYIGREPAVISEDGSGLASGFYDLTALSLSDGIDSSYAYLDLTWDEEAGVGNVDVPMAYYPPDGGEVSYDDVLLSLVFDEASGDVISETYYTYNADLGTYGELTADPAGLIVPEVYVAGADGPGAWSPAADVGLYADLPSLQYDLESLPSGTQLYIVLTVTDFGGNSDHVGAYVTVP